jgi:hypothetical protein
MLVNQHEAILNTCLNYLHSNHSKLQSRSISCVGSLCQHLNDDHLKILTDTLLAQLHVTGETKDSGDNTVNVNNTINCFAHVAKHVGHRLGHLVPETIPLFLKEIGDVSDTSDEMTSDSKNELRENMCNALTKFAEVRIPPPLHPSNPPLFPFSLLFLGSLFVSPS